MSKRFDARPSSFRWFVTVPLLLWLLSEGAIARPDATPRDHGFGRVDMANTCAPSVQDELQGALSKLHSFEADASDFLAVTRRDPDCVIAFWGAAMSARGNPLAGVLDAASLRTGRGLIAKAKALRAGSKREHALVDALDIYFRPYDGDHAARTAAYEAAMRQVHEAYSDDTDITAFYALSILEAVDLRDATYARQRKAGAILETLWAAHPTYPGAPHYLIHAYDYPALAHGAVAAAEQYPLVAPASSHAQHMPAHIWSMLGEWTKSIDANQRSGIVAEPAAARNATQADIVYPHAYDFIAYARLQLAQDAQLARDVKALHGGGPLIVKARMALEHDDWAAAAALTVPSDDSFDAAVARFTRALGAARLRRIAEARDEGVKLRNLRAAVVESEGDYWGGLVDIYVGAAQAWISQAAGEPDKARAEMRAAADLDDGLQKHNPARKQAVADARTARRSASRAK